jgi:hypothetical protein
MFTITKAELQLLTTNGNLQRDTLSDIIAFFTYFVVRVAKEGKTSVDYAFIDKYNIIDEVLGQLKNIYINCEINFY